MIHKWIDKFFAVLSNNKLFHSKIVNVILIIMAIFYSAMVWKSVIENSEGIGQPPLQPITITDIRLLDTNIAQDNAIFVQINGQVNFRHCETYVLGSIIITDSPAKGNENNRVILDKVTTFSIDAIDKAIDEHVPIRLNVGHLTKGKYLFRAEFHEICGGKSYIILAPLVSFEVK